jgi:putative peptide zinc metalloprotease protein
MQTLLLNIAPDDRMEAVLIVDQGDRESLRQNQEVEVRLDHLPDRIFPSRITQISPRSLEFAPEPLSNKYGGPLPTTTDAQGRQKLTSVAYQATVLLDEQTRLLRTGAIGQARVLVEERSALSWTWKWLRQTFYFRL